MPASLKVAPLPPETPPDDNMDRIRALLSDLRASFPDKEAEVAAIMHIAFPDAAPVLLPWEVRSIHASRGYTMTAEQHARFFIAERRKDGTPSLCLRCRTKDAAPKSMLCGTCLPADPAPTRTIGAAIEQAHRDAQLQRAELRKWD